MYQGLGFERIALGAGFEIVFAGMLIMDMFGNIGGVITDPFKIFGHEQQVGTGRNCPRIAHHIGQQLAKQGVIMLINLRVGKPYRQSHVDLTALIGVKRIGKP